MDDLSDIQDLASLGEPVRWPHGWSEASARSALNERPKSTTIPRAAILSQPVQQIEMLPFGVNAQPPKRRRILAFGTDHDLLAVNKASTDFPTTSKRDQFHFLDTAPFYR